MLEESLFLLAPQISNFLIRHLSRAQSVRPYLITYHLLCSTCMTYGSPCHSIGHQVLPIQPKPREGHDFSTHIRSLLPTKRYYLVGSIYVLGSAKNIITTSHCFSKHSLVTSYVNTCVS